MGYCWSLDGLLLVGDPAKATKATECFLLRKGRRLLMGHPLPPKQISQSLSLCANSKEVGSSHEILMGRRLEKASRWSQHEWECGTQSP